MPVGDTEVRGGVERVGVDRREREERNVDKREGLGRVVTPRGRTCDQRIKGKRVVYLVRVYPNRTQSKKIDQQDNQN